MKNKKIVLFSLKSCRYCRDMYPEWESFKQAYKKSETEIKNKYNTIVEIIEYDAELNNNETTAAGVKSFPTIIIIEDNKNKNFSSERTAVNFFRAVIPEATYNDIQEWLNSVNYGNLATEVVNFGGLGKKSNYYRKYIKYKNKYIKIKKQLLFV